MLAILTPTRRLENWKVYGTRKVTKYLDDEFSDRFAELPCIKNNGGFKVTVLAKEPCGRVVAEKPDLQIIFENLSEEEKNVFKSRCDLLDGEEALRISKIDLSRELESWLGTITSVSSAKTYRYGITKFLKYCEAGGIIPLMISGTEAREFRNWLKANSASNPVIRATIIACSKLVDIVFESHNLHRRNPFKVKDLLPPKKRVKPLWVPDQAEVDRLLDFTKNLVAFTAIKLIIKYGMRIGAFEKMTVADNKAVTVTKGKEMSYTFDDEAVSLWRSCPLNKFTTRELADRVNWHLKRAFEEKVVRQRYSVHDLRHFYARKTLKETGGDVYKVSRDLGHSNLGTTGTYLESLEKEGLSGEEI